MSSIRDLVEEFVDHLSTALETQVVARARLAVEAALAGRALPKGNGRLSAAALTITAGGVRKPRKKAPVQLCPVPGCSERAAPIFGMVCAKHKDVSKTKIRQYREARRAGKLAAKGATKTGGRKGAKAAQPRRARARKAPAQKVSARRSVAKPRKASTSPKVEIVQKPAQVRAGAAATRVKAAPVPPAPAQAAAPVLVNCGAMILAQISCALPAG